MAALGFRYEAVGTRRLDSAFEAIPQGTTTRPV
jgi:hypothetical protein